MAQSAPAPATGGSDQFPVSASMLPLTIMLFFMVGFVTVLVDPLVAKFRAAFSLSYAEAMLTQFCYFLAYFMISLPASRVLDKLGYLRGTVLGFVTVGVGILLFIPAIEVATYWVFLAALFIIATGITMIQVVMNPLASGLGPAATAPQRLTLAQAFNSVATTVGPLLAGYFIFDAVTEAGAGSDAGSLRVLETPCLVLACVMFAIAALFWVLRRNERRERRESAHWHMPSLRENPRLAFGALCIFTYVGAEVAIGSLMINYLGLESTLGLDEKTATHYLAYYWGAAMVGRFIGSAVMSKVQPARVLAFCALMSGVLAAVSAVTTGPISAYTALLIGLFNSVMFPSIFSLSVKDMNDQTPAASGLLCLAIVGGAIVPVVTGKMADLTNLHVSMIIPVLCYVTIVAFALLCARGALENGVGRRTAARLAGAD
ncbi:sugar MFS transporter [Niveispirillum irakense]|uniref:sugar MFS transporter n=1 Tax=Niveispirillum irakense TaxID=34011 RepID=UPI001AEC4F35|nr:sugar MFS transporter [Niveispirillum irakense]